MHKAKKKIKIGVLRGGLSCEHKVSLKTGESVLANLSDKYEKYDIVINSDGQWYLNRIVSSPQAALASVDLIFNALHGNYGEDGKIQQLFTLAKVPYTGSKVMASALGMNKMLAREAFQ